MTHEDRPNLRLVGESESAPVRSELDIAKANAQLQLKIKEARAHPLGLYKLCFRDDRGEPVVLKWFHVEWFDLWLSSARNILIEASRGLSKTTSIVANVLWHLGHNQNLRIKLICGNDKQAEKRLAEIRSHIKSDYLYQLAFPDVQEDKDKKNDSLSLTLVRSRHGRDATIEARGVLSDGTGDRADLLIFDDACNFKNSVQEASTRERVFHKIDSDWMNTLNPRDGRAWFIFTPWHCFPQGHRLLTASGELKRVEDIKEGELLDDGFAPTHVLHNRPEAYDGDLIKVTVETPKYGPKTITTTPRHGMPTLRGLVYAEDLRPSDSLVQASHSSHANAVPVYYEGVTRYVVPLPIRKIERVPYKGKVFPVKTESGYLNTGFIYTHNSEDAHAKLKRRAIKQPDEWVYRRYAHGKPGDPFHSIFPELFSSEHLRSIAEGGDGNDSEGTGAVAYAKAYLCLLMSEEGQIVQPTWLRTYTRWDMTPALLNRCIAFISIDPVGGQKKTTARRNKGRDFMGVSILLLDPNPEVTTNPPRPKVKFRIYVVDAYHMRVSTLQAAQHIVDLNNQWQAQAVFVEVHGTQTMDEWVTNLDPTVTVIPIPVTMGKRQRLEAITPILQDPAQYVLFSPKSVQPSPPIFPIVIGGKSPTTAKARRVLRNEILNFPTKHDDVQDAVVQALDYIKTYVVRYLDAQDADDPDAGPKVSMDVRVISI